MPDASPPKSKLVTIRNAFISGALLLAPLWVTVWAFTAIIGFVGGSFRPLYEHTVPESWQNVPFLLDLLTTIVVIILVTLLGFLSSYVFGKYFLSMGERAIQRIPGIGAVYNSVKQIVSTFGTNNRSLFNKVVLVEFPRKGVWTLGFLTNKDQGEPQSIAGGGAETWTVFVPTTPNPTSGFLLMLPKAEVVELDMSVGDGMKMLLSGGAVVPPWPNATPVTVPALAATAK